MDTTTLLSIARTQLDTLIGLTTDEDAIVRLRLAVAALDAPALNPSVPVAAAPVAAARIDAAPQPLDDDEDEYSDDEPERQIPDGFDSLTAYDNFLLSQAAAIADDEHRPADAYTDGVIGVVGLTDDGEQLGDADALVEQANIFAAEAREIEAAEREDGQYDAPDEINVTEFRVSYTRSDDSPLSEQQVHEILDAPASRSLQLLGTLLDVQVEAGDSDAQKVAVLRFDRDGLDLETIARGIVAYRGVKVFAGIGQVLAVGQAA